MTTEALVRVFLRRSCGPRGGKLYGPGWANVPESFAKSLGLAPDLVQTDAAGAPRTDTIAASALGASRTLSGVVNAHPNVERDEDGDAVEVEDDALSTDPVARARAEIAQAAENDERTGGTLQSESESHTDDANVLTSQPGHVPTDDERRELEARQAADAANARRAPVGATRGAGQQTGGTSTGEGETGGRVTKVSLREYGDADALRKLAADRGVRLKGGGADMTKGELVDALYDAEVAV